MDDLSILRSIVESDRTCTVITEGRGGNLRARTMTRLNSIDKGFLDFPTSSTSAKVGDVRADPRVTVFFVNPRTRDTATIYGTGEIVTDLEEKRRCWNDWLARENRWPQGSSAPTFVVFRVHLSHGEYLIAETEVYGKVPAFSAC